MSTDILVRNNVRVWGNGSQPMIFAHGFGCDQNMWRYMTPAFEEHYKIILFDYVGCGHSDLAAYNNERYAALEGYAQDVLEICASLNLEQSIFVGHSVSCMIGLLAAIHQPRHFSHLIMIGPSPCYVNEEGYTGGFSRQDLAGLLNTMEQNYIGWSNFLAPKIMAHPDRPQLGQELADSFCSTDPVIARNFAAATFFSDNRKDLEKLSLPALILQCSDDIIAPMEVGQYLHEHLPQSTLNILEATGHCPHMSEPEETIAAIQGYLKDQGLH